MFIASLEEKAWGADMMPTTIAAKVAVTRLNKKLNATSFPFEVKRTERELKTVWRKTVHPKQLETF
jgi:DNA-binding response OmpR family regulator